MSSAPRTKPRRPLTNTNTDDLCVSDHGRFRLLRTWMYRFNLWTGLYMLNPYERMVYHIVGWFILIVSLAYFSVFGSGFRDGLKQANADAK
jgi:hypothetical protein